MSLSTAQKHELIIQFNQQRAREQGETSDFKQT